ncbi:MAG: hypothetical protein QXT79_03115 [Thermofilaceae archaeon]
MNERIKIKEARSVAYEKKLMLPALIHVHTCNMKTCSYYAALLSKYTLGCLQTEGEYFYMKMKVLEKIQQLAKKFLEERGIKYKELVWTTPICPGMCPVENECLQLVAIIEDNISDYELWALQRSLLKK